MGVLKGLRQHRGAASLAEIPLSSESGGAALGWLLRGRGEVEEEGVEGSVTARCCQWEAAAVGRSGLVEVEEEEGQWSA